MLKHGISLVLLLFATIPAYGRTFNATVESKGYYFEVTLDTEFNPVTAPASGEVVKAGTSYTVRWKKTTTDIMNFELAWLNSDSSFTIVPYWVGDDRENTGSHVWDVDDDIPGGSNYAFIISGKGISPYFVIANPAVPSYTATRAPSSKPTISPTTSPSATQTSDLASQTTPSPTSPTSESSTSSPSSAASSSPASSSSKSGAVVGGAVGGTLGGIILVLAAALLFILRRRRAKGRAGGPSDGYSGRAELHAVSHPRSELVGGKEDATTELDGYRTQKRAELPQEPFTDRGPHELPI